MFEVRLYYPFDEFDMDKELAIESAAGVPIAFSGASACQRDIGWVVPTFVEARELKARLDPHGSVRIQEAIEETRDA